MTAAPSVGRGPVARRGVDAEAVPRQRRLEGGSPRKQSPVSELTLCIVYTFSRSY
jgi:hypothetical protein